MTQKLESLLQAGGLKAEPFAPTSRYHGLPAATFTSGQGRTLSHLRRRFIAPPGSFTQVQEHMVVQGDRPDTLAAHYLGDAEQFWRIADANNVLRPNDLTDEPGSRLRITLPEGIPGTGDA